MGFRISGSKQFLNSLVTPSEDEEVTQTGNGNIGFRVFEFGNLCISHAERTKRGKAERHIKMG